MGVEGFRNFSRNIITPYNPLIPAIINPVIENKCIGVVEKLIARFPYSLKSFVKE